MDASKAPRLGVCRCCVLFHDPAVDFCLLHAKTIQIWTFGKLPDMLAPDHLWLFNSGEVDKCSRGNWSHGYIWYLVFGFESFDVDVIERRSPHHIRV